MDIMLQRILSLIPDRHGADAEFARSLGYKSGNVVADWRAGRSGSYRGKLREIAEKYNVTVDWLCGNSPQIEKPALPAEDGLGGESLGALLARLTPAEKQRVRDFAAGLLAARNGGPAAVFSGVLSWDKGLPAAFHGFIVADDESHNPD